MNSLLVLACVLAAQSEATAVPPPAVDGTVESAVEAPTAPDSVVAPVDPVVAPVAPVAPVDPVATPTLSSPTPAPLRADAEAEAAYRACTILVKDHADADVVHDCFTRVAIEHRGTEGGLQADASVVLLDLQGEKPAGGLEIPAGRLGITTTLGLFGVWNAVAGGLLVSTNAPLTNGTGLVAGTGVAALVLGVAGGFGGYYLADRLQLDEGSARLVASGVIWGTVIGSAMAPTVASIGDKTGFNLAITGVVAAGYIGGGGAVLLASFIPFDEAQVSMINSGGFIGGTLGVLALPNLLSAQVEGIAPYSLTFAGATTVGLVAGGIVGRKLSLTWGEALLCDLGGVLGGIAGGTVSVVLGGAGVDNVTLLTLPPAVGLVAGYVGGAVFVSQWRANRGAPVWRDAPAVRPTAMAIVSGQNVVPGVGVVGTF